MRSRHAQILQIYIESQQTEFNLNFQLSIFLCLSWFSLQHEVQHKKLEHLYSLSYHVFIIHDYFICLQKFFLFLFKPHHNYLNTRNLCIIMHRDQGKRKKEQSFLMFSSYRHEKKNLYTIFKNNTIFILLKKNQN